MKRLIDIIVAVVMLVLTMPLLFLLALIVRIAIGSPVLFRQQRAGLNGQPFVLVKFRTMMNTCDTHGNELPDAQRITRLGSFLRSTSLDELPEFWNVLVGDMSLVGPRPLLMEYIPKYSLEQARRHNVRPGITGWAQVNGRNAISWDDRLSMDVWYVEHFSALLDLKILWMTVSAVFSFRGISYAGHATMPKFMGNSSSSTNEENHEGKDLSVRCERTR